MPFRFLRWFLVRRAAYHLPGESVSAQKNPGDWHRDFWVASSRVKRNRVRCVSGSGDTGGCAILRSQIFRRRTCNCGLSGGRGPRDAPGPILQLQMNRCSIRSFIGSLFASWVVSLVFRSSVVPAALGGVFRSVRAMEYCLGNACALFLDYLFLGYMRQRPEGRVGSATSIFLNIPSSGFSVEEIESRWKTVLSKAPRFFG